YRTPPFRGREVGARSRALRRRAARSAAGSTATAAPTTLTVADLRIEPGARTVERAGVTVHLTPTEFDLLVFLVRRPGQVFTRAQLLTDVWGYRDGSGARTVDSHVRALRAKLGPDAVRTVHGVGYGLGVTVAATGSAA
ncbi:MAG: winged helix-turn-helix domain-containing protein, partial [Actinomycetota bacterium]